MEGKTKFKDTDDYKTILGTDPNPIVCFVIRFMDLDKSDSFLFLIA